MTSRRHLLTTLATLPMHTLWASEVTRFPSRPIKLVVPFAAGGGTDIVARLIATKVAPSLGQPMIVDNRGGAGGSLGSDVVAKSPADGYTLLMATVSTHAINPALNANLPYDPIRSFAPVSLVAKVGGVVAVNSKSAITTLRQLADATRQDPSRYSFGSQGVGGIGHLMGEMFNTQAEIRAVHVPYKGAAPALQDLIAGNIQVIYDTLPALLPHIQSGALRALAVTTPTRQASIAHVPTTAEAGYPRFLAATWNAIVAPAGTPAEAIDLLNQAIVQAVRDPSVTQRMKELSAEPQTSTPTELREFMREELQRWRPVVQASGVMASVKAENKKNT